MSQETTLLPEVITTPEFKERVDHACQASHLPYTQVVIRLLEEWMNGNIAVEGEPDPDFVASAREAFQSAKVQDALKQLGEHFDPHRTYPHALKAP